jgi:hypothetical protein
LIDSTNEILFPLAQAADDLLPRLRRGRKVNLSTLYRWSTPPGCRGVVLETLQCGATRCTSREALQRFFERLSGLNRAGADDPITTKPLPVRRSCAQRLRDSERAGKLLEKAGA